jgi:t-SNARE complex subunit (syntaxin)
MSPKNADDTISKIDSIIRVLSKSTPHGNLIDQNDIDALNEIEEEDKPKLADRLEDLIVLLKEEPDNKRKILELHDTTNDEFGHVPPVFDVLNSVKGFFLAK